MLKKLPCILTTALLAGAVLYYFTGTPRNTNTLVLGTMSGWPPFVSIGPSGSYEGFDIEIANIIAQKLGKDLVIKDMDTVMLISSLEQGSVDFIMTGLDITPERSMRMTMIPYQGEPITQYPLIFWKEIPEGLQTLDDLKKLPNAIICVESGSSQEEVLKNYSGFTIKNVDPLIALLELKNNRATATLLDMKMFNTIKQKEPNLKARMMPLAQNEIMLGCGIGLKKGSALTKEIETIIDDLKRSGELQALETRWFGGDV